MITVDGLAGSGKTSLSRELAKILKFKHLNSGLLYRAVGYLCLTHRIDPEDFEKVGGLLAKHTILLTGSAESERGDIVLDSVVVTEKLLSPEVSEAASRVAQHQNVRTALIEHQRQAFPGESVVAEGRDMGTVIFPDADLKFFVEVDRDTRIKRRSAQLGLNSADEPTRAAIMQEIVERDARDSMREAAPTKPAPDAIKIDNSSAPLTEVVNTMYDFASLRGLACGISKAGIPKMQR